MAKYIPLHTDFLPFRRKVPTSEVEITLQCFADPEIFAEEFDLMPKSIPCEGSGIVGPWCTQCVFGDYRDSGTAVRT